MDQRRKNAILNVTAGILAGYGMAQFLCFLALDTVWANNAPHEPNYVLGLIYLHNQHGSYTYFSAFQATACWIMFATSIPMALIGAFIAPKKNLIESFRWYGGRQQYEQDDPRGLLKWSMIISATIGAVLIFIVGPPVVSYLNATGIVLHL